MNIPETLHRAVAALPDLAQFAVFLALVGIVPRLSRRLHLPAPVGLLLCGVALGPHLLDVFPTQHPMVGFFSELGMLLLMFSTGLEIDLKLFRERLSRSVGFGIVTAVFPLLLGTLVACWLGYALVSAIVVGSLLASHTLLASIIVKKLGVSHREPVVVTIGATMISDTLALLVFAICVPVYVSGFSASGLAIQIIEIAVFVPLVLVGLGRGGAHVLRKVEQDEEASFIVMLGLLAVAALLAHAIRLPEFIGAFLAGLAVNAAAKGNPAKGKLEFIGNTLFVPSFFIATGFLIDPSALARSLAAHSFLGVGLLAALVGGKWLAAEFAGRAFGYAPVERQTMWSLTLPQVATTLAATLVAHRTLNAAGQPLLDDPALNAVLVLVLVTAILGPVLTQYYAARLQQSPPDRRSGATPSTMSHLLLLTVSAAFTLWVSSATPMIPFSDAAASTALPASVLSAGDYPSLPARAAAANIAARI